VPLPDIRQQEEIITYLDQETSQMDTLISKKEQLIEKLLERRQALITQVVTKGLDPNVPMKDSGVEWLGEVPSAWQVKPHWAFLKEKKVPVGNLHSELTLLSLTKQGVIVRDLEAGGKFPTSFEGYQKVAPDDLVLCLFDVEETPRTVGLAPSEGMITSAYTLMRATGINPHFLEWYLIGMDNEKRFKPFYSGLRNTLQKPIFASIRFAVPLSSEQAEIVQYLDQETSQMDTLVEKTRRAIELLKERRQALITQVVTGKIDVRGFAGGNS
jgi:type I restriction enzyme S subunit